MAWIPSTASVSVFSAASLSASFSFGPHPSSIPSTTIQIKAAAHIFFFISCSFTLSITQYIRSYLRMRLVAHGLYDYTVDEGEVQGVNRKIIAVYTL